MKNIFLIYLFLQTYLCLYNDSEFPDNANNLVNQDNPNNKDNQDNPNNPDNPDNPNNLDNPDNTDNPHNKDDQDIQDNRDISDYIDISDIPDISSFIKANYQLNVKNENGGDEIELKPGIFSKIFFHITPLNKMITGGYYIFLNETSYKLRIKDEKIIAFEKEIIIQPNKDFIFSTYIGLSCSEEIEDSEYKIPLIITHLNDSTEEIPIKYEDINVKINKEKAKFELDIILKSIPGKSFNFFKISNELYNTDDITIKFLNQTSLKEIVIEPFNKRSELSENNPENHGILSF